jgi:hypothetical protein
MKTSEWNKNAPVIPEQQPAQDNGLLESCCLSLFVPLFYIMLINSEQENC